ncbi:MAG TPA: site-2 protease family protein [Verrucomicrobiae bacterium]|nr:site-2 protease family protein [Verrucomicrobiae bacterium]
MKCDRCGNESDFEAAFIKERKSFHTSKRTLCIKCWSRQKRRFEGTYQVAVLIGGGVGGLLLWLNPYSGLGEFLVFLFLVNLFLILSIIPHELGHAIVARMVGWRVFRIIIGIGKAVEKFRLFGFDFEIHVLPVGGITRIAPVDVNWLRTKRFFVVLAGPAVNVFIAAVIWFFQPDEWLFDRLPLWLHALHLFLIANIVLAVFNLLPYKNKIYGVGSDGKQILKCFFPDKLETELVLGAYYVLEAELRRDEGDIAGAREWCERGITKYPDNLNLLNMQGILCLATGDYGSAREIFKRLLDRETKPGLLRYVLMNNVAYTDALLEDPQLLPEADKYSIEAYGALSSQPAIIGTRGTVLLMQGKLPEAIQLLTESFEAHAVARAKAENACFLAMAYARSGNPEQGKKFLNIAKELRSDAQLISRVEKELNEPSLRAV